MPEIVPDIFIREATYDDLPDVARINVLSWQQTYAGKVPQTYLDGLRIADRLESWKQIFDGNTAEDKNLYLALHQTDAIGFISFGRGRDEGMTDIGEIYAVYLLKEFWGRGVGYKLFQMTRRKLIEAGYASAYLWVLESNTQAIEAYQKWGGIIDHSKVKTITIHGQPIQEIAIIFPQL